MAAGVTVLELTVPGLTSGSVNCFVLSTDDGPVLIDSGHADPACWDALEAGVRSTGADITELRTVLLTHAHYDHAGSAARLQQEHRTRVGLSLAERPFLGDSRPQGELERQLHALCLRAGAPASGLPTPAPLLVAEPGAEQQAPLRIDVPLQDGDVVPLGGEWDVEVLGTPGHSPGHVAFVLESRSLVFGGDALFARGTPVFALFEEPDPPAGLELDDPVTDYVASLERLAATAPRLLLPGHGIPVADVAERATQVTQRCLERRRAVETALVEHPGATAWEVAAAVPWGAPWGQMEPRKRRAALLTTFAFLRTLHREGRLERVSDEPLRYACKGEGGHHAAP